MLTLAMAKRVDGGDSERSGGRLYLTSDQIGCDCAINGVGHMAKVAVERWEGLKLRESVKARRHVVLLQEDPSHTTKRIMQQVTMTLPMLPECGLTWCK